MGWWKGWGKPKDGEAATGGPEGDVSPWVAGAARMGWEVRATGPEACTVSVTYTEPFAFPVFLGVVLRGALAAESSGWTYTATQTFEEADESLRRVHGHFLHAPSRTLLSVGDRHTATVPVPADQVVGGLFMSRTNHAWVRSAAGVLVLFDHDRPPHLFDLGFRDTPRDELPVHEYDLVVDGEPRLVPRPPATGEGGTSPV
jgi:hypothetical protein